MGVVRASKRTIPCERAASGREGASLGRTGFHLRLGSLCWPSGRHAHVRRLRAIERIAEEVWIYAGRRGRGGQRRDRQVTIEVCADLNKVKALELRFAT